MTGQALIVITPTESAAVRYVRQMESSWGFTPNNVPTLDIEHMIRKAERADRIQRKHAEHAARKAAKAARKSLPRD
jgi:hypothetical protein